MAIVWLNVVIFVFCWLVVAVHDWLPLPNTAQAYFKTVFPTGFQNMHSDTKLTVKDTTDAKKTANSTSRRPESNGKTSRTRIRSQILNQQFKLEKLLRRFNTMVIKPH